MTKEEILKIAYSIPSTVLPEECETLYELARGCSSGSIVEIGSLLGRSTVVLGGGSKEGNNRPVYSIDPFVEPADKIIDTATKLRDNLIRAGVSHLVLTLAKFSEQVAPWFDYPVELIFIDGSHLYPDVQNDFEMWFPKVIKGGTLAFHDALSEGIQPISWPGVDRLCKEIQRQGLVEGGRYVKSMFVCRKV